MPSPAVPAASLNIEISTWRNLILIPAPVDLNTRLDRLLHCIHCRTAVEECSTNLTELHRGDTPSPLQCNYSQFLSESQTESSTAAMNVIENKMKERCVVREQSRRDLSVTWRGNDGEDGDWEGGDVIQLSPPLLLVGTGQGHWTRLSSFLFLPQISLRLHRQLNTTALLSLYNSHKKESLEVWQ